jgi:NAD(P)-dependent dehydrogenase (short-subunit alcohol dehydrogenase family)
MKCIGKLNMNSSTNERFIKFDLTGEWALITGGAGLLGVEHSLALLEAGANIVLWDIDENQLFKVAEQLKKEYVNQSIITSCVDITSEDAVRKAQNKLEFANIIITILINNAANNPKYNLIQVGTESSRIENMSKEDWDQQIAVGLTGAFICSKYFGSKMASIKKGVILNISSDLSVISPDQRLYKVIGVDSALQPVKPLTYSVIKSGLIGMTLYLSTYWSSDGVRVNALSPGGVYENQDKEFVSKINDLIPLGRMARSDEYRSAVQFLCSSASEYMTGQNIVIDGGRSVW